MKEPASFTLVAESVAAYFRGETLAVLSPVAEEAALQLRELLPADPRFRGSVVHALAWYHWCRSNVLPYGDNEVDLNTSLQLFNEVAAFDRSGIPQAVLAILEGEEDHPLVRKMIGDALLRRYAADEDDGTLDSAIMEYLLALDRFDTGSSEYIVCLAQVGVCLLQCFRRTGKVEAVTLAAQALSDVLARFPRGSGVRLPLLSDAAEALLARDRLTDTEDGIDRAIALYEEAIEFDSGNPHHKANLADLGLALSRRYGRTGSPLDLDAAIDQCRRAMRAYSPDEPLRVTNLSNLADALLRRHDLTQRRDDLDEAMGLAREAVQAAPVDDPQLHLYRSVLAHGLWRRFQADDARADADEAVDLTTAAIETVPPTDNRLGTYQVQLAVILAARARRYGIDADFDTAIRLAETAVATSSPSSRELAYRLDKLYVAHRFRFDHYGDGGDLAAALEAAEQAAFAIPDDDPDYWKRRQQLGGALAAHYYLTGDAAALDRAIACYERAFTAAPADEPDLAMVLSEWGGLLLDRHLRTGDLADIEAAVVHSRRAVDLGSPDWHRRTVLFGNLAASLFGRCRHTPDRADLAEARGYFEASLELFPSDHPERAKTLGALADLLAMQLQLDGDAGLIDAFIDTATEAATIPTAPVTIRIEQAQRAADAIITRGLLRGGDPAAGYRDALPLYSMAMDLLPILTWQGLRREERQRRLEATARSLPHYAAACAVELGSHELAVRFLEQGRGVLWNQLLQLRSDISALHRAHPALAVAVEQCRAELDRHEVPHHAASLDSDDRSVRARRIAAVRSFDSLVGEIRALPATADLPHPEEFLRLPALESLLPPEDAGPVVVLNVGRRCDALIVSASGVEAVPLRFDAAEAFAQADRYFKATERHRGRATRDQFERETGSVLAWAWDAIVEPILDHLGCLDPTAAPLPRIWWCPTGPLTLLPIHAAGRHGAGERRGVIDVAVSSYTPSLRALAEARARAAPPGDPRLLIVSLAKTPNGKHAGSPEFAELPGARVEQHLLEAAVPEDRRTTLCDADATREAVTKGLSDHSWVHVSCHGTQDLMHPSKAGLVPYDWVEHGLIGLGDLTDSSIAGGEFAFLAACQTAAGGVTSLDEAIHLTAAMQHSGWRHVIGTLWNVEDRAAVVVASQVYSRIVRDGVLDPSDSARALHEAVRVLRDEDPADTARWSRFIHSGP